MKPSCVPFGTTRRQRPVRGSCTTARHPTQHFNPAPGLDIFAANAFEVPATLPTSSLHDLLTVFLDATHGKGGILNVVNDTGGSSTIANPDVPVTVVSYP
jgi:hypothetical protein